MYGNGYSWCISQTSHNMFTTYILEDGASIYFVLNKKLDRYNNERLCVILRYDDDTFGITDMTNKGNRSGGHGVAMDYKLVEKELPWLKGMKKLFKYNPVSRDEKVYADLVSTKFTGDILGAYIIDLCKKLRIDGQEVSPIDFLRDYSSNHRITDKQLSCLNSEMISELVEQGIYIPLIYIPSNLRVRYAINCFNKSQIKIDLKEYSDDELKRVFQG